MLLVKRARILSLCFLLQSIERENGGKQAEMSFMTFALVICTLILNREMFGIV